MAAGAAGGNFEKLVVPFIDHVAFNLVVGDKDVEKLEGLSVTCAFVVAAAGGEVETLVVPFMNIGKLEGLSVTRALVALDNELEKLAVTFIL